MLGLEKQFQILRKETPPDTRQTILNKLVVCKKDIPLQNHNEQNMIEAKTETLNDRQIKLFMMYGKTIKYAQLDNGKIVLCSDGIFDALFKENKYGHEARLKKKMSVDADYQEGSKRYYLFSLQKYERFFLDYKVQTAAYLKSLQKQDGRYDNYINFISDGGVNKLYKKVIADLGIEEEHEYKNTDKSYLEIIESKMDKTIVEIEAEDDEQIEEKNTAPEVMKSALRRTLTNEDVYLWSTVLLVMCLMPFTFLALLKYLTISEEGWQLYLSYFMVGGLSFTFEWSILIFTINGRKKLANIGSIFQIIFIAVHFNLISDLAGADAQTYITKIFAVVYSAILINQFSELSHRKETK